MCKKSSFKTAIILILLALFLPAIPAAAIDQAMPGDQSPDPHARPDVPPAPMPTDPSFITDSAQIAEFRAKIQLADFRLLALSDNSGQIKIIDSWARQSLKRICHRESWQGQDPVYTALDMALRPEVWNDENIIFVEAVPIRERLAGLASGEGAARGEEANRILVTGLVSPRFIARPDVQQTLETIKLNVAQATAVDKIIFGQRTFDTLFLSLIIAPPGAAERTSRWRHPIELAANTTAPATLPGAASPPPIVPGYTSDQALRLTLAVRQLIVGWREGDVTLANQAIASFTEILPAIDPGGYPSHAKRVTELWYNRTFYGTIANVFLYFIAMTLFLLVAVGAAPKLRRVAYVIFTIAVALHLVSMGVRFWLAGRWPTQNEFESIMAAALLGCIVGWLLETWKKNGLFGMAFSFVGFLAMTACMSSPWFGADIGGEISKTAGILQTYWLYIHVNVVISSYALISASFLLGLVYLGMQLWFWINPIESGGEGEEILTLEGSRTTAAAPASETGAALLPELATAQLTARRGLLSVLDQANMVILQMAFWFLGIGIICGAIWADHSWGRPWGWDPKETFALITWIVYLIIVHMRIVIPRVKADTTAILSIVGFGIMMFNWIGVNFFLAGLHSYA